MLSFLLHNKAYRVWSSTCLCANQKRWCIFGH